LRSNIYELNLVLPCGNATECWEGDMSVWNYKSETKLILLFLFVYTVK